MAATEVSICNQALGWLGANLITSLDDETNEARLCKANYSNLRRAVIEEASWRFAIARRKLTPLQEKPVYGYENRFQLPANLISVEEVSDGNREIDEWDREGDTVLADVQEVYIKYTWDVVDPARFSPGFVQALAARLAADLAIPIAESRQLQSDMVQMYAAKLVNADTLDSMQGRNQPITSNRLKKVR